MKMYCEKCGLENPEESKFCKGCGEILVNETAEQVTEEKKPKGEKKGGRWISAISMVLNIAVVMMLLSNLVTANIELESKIGKDKVEYDLPVTLSIPALMGNGDILKNDLVNDLMADDNDDMDRFVGTMEVLETASMIIFGAIAVFFIIAAFTLVVGMKDTWVCDLVFNIVTFVISAVITLGILIAKTMLKTYSVGLTITYAPIVALACAFVNIIYIVLLKKKIR